jgi:hypothetical protein
VCGRVYILRARRILTYMLLLLALMSVAEAPGRPPVVSPPCPITVDLTGHLHAPFLEGSNACKVEIQLRVAGWEDALVAGALANAWHESGWKSDIPGDGGKSLGFWQLHEKGLGKGMGSARLDLRQSTDRVIRSVAKQRKGRKFTRPGEASRFFCRKVMRPARLKREMAARGRTAAFADE